MPPALAELAQTLEGQGATVAVAVGGRDRPKRLDPSGRDITDKIGPIEVLVACAGIGSLTLVPELDTTMLRRTLEVNLVGVAQSIEAVLPGMIDAGTRPYRRSGERGRLSRFSLDDVLFRVQGGPDRLPRGDAARPAPARRDGDDGLSGFRADPDEHRAFPISGRSR